MLFISSNLITTRGVYGLFQEVPLDMRMREWRALLCGVCFRVDLSLSHPYTRAWKHKHTHTQISTCTSFGRLSSDDNGTLQCCRTMTMTMNGMVSFYVLAHDSPVILLRTACVWNIKCDSCREDFKHFNILSDTSGDEWGNKWVG